MGRPRLLYPCLENSDAEPGQAGGTGHAVHGHAFPFGRLHADAVRDSHRTLLLAFVSQARRATGILAEPDRAGPDDSCVAIEKSRLLYSGCRQMASRTRRPSED